MVSRFATESNRMAKTELEEAGLETEGMVDSTAKLRSEILALSGVDIMENANEFKSTYKIMDELAVKWKDLSDIQQATVTELIAGKRQGNIVSSLMTNFDTARDALETSLNSSGSAMAEHEKWQQSLEAQINSLKASWQALSQAFLRSDFLKVVLNSVIGLVDGLTKLVDKLGTIGTIGLGVGIFGLFKNRSAISNIIDFGKALFNSSISVEDFAKATIKGHKGAKAFISSFSGWAAIGGIAITVISGIINAIKKAKEETSKLRQETIQASDEFLESASSFEQAYIKYSGKTNLTVEEEKELESAIKGTVDALGDKSSALHNAVNSSNDYVASLEAIAKAELKAAESAALNKKNNAELELQDLAKGWASIDGGEIDVKIGSKFTSDEMRAIDIAKKVGGKYYTTLNSSGKTQNRTGQTQVTTGFRLSADASADEIVDYYYTLIEYQQKLNEAAEKQPDLIETSAFKNVTSVIEELSDAVGAYESGIYDAAKAQYQLSEGIPKTTKEYLEMREAIIQSDDIKNLSLSAKSSIANTLDSEYKQIFDLTSAEVQARKFVGIIESYGDGTKDGTNEISVIETFLNMRTAVNNNDCTVGEYMAQFDEINKITANWSDEEKKLLNTSFGIDTDAIKQQYKDISDYLSRFYYEDTRNMDRDEEYDYKFKARENRKKIEEFLNGLTADELAAVIDIRTEIDWENTSAEDIRKQIEDRVKLNEALNFNASIEVDKTALEALNTTLAESASAMGLSEESIDSLKAKYSDLEGYNPHTLFEKTANGVKVNREELAKLEKKYNDLTKTEVQEHLDTLVEEYNKCTKAIDGNIGSQEKLELISKREKYAQQIEELAEYQAQLEGVTGAYQRWIDAQNTPEDYEGYQAVATGREDIEDEIGRGFISNATKEYIDLLSGEDLVGGTIDDYANAWEKLDQKVGSTSYSIHDFFTVNDDGDITSTGIDRFFKGLQQDFKGEVAKFNEKSGKWEYDFSQENLQKIQDEWGIGIEAIELLLEAAASAGYDVDWGGIFDDLDLDTSNFESLVSVAEQAQKELNKLKGYEDLDFNFSTTTVEAATSELEKAQKTYNELVTGDDGKININAEGADNARVILATLLVQKQQLEDSEIAINISTSGLDESQAKAVAWVQDFRAKYKNLEIAISTGEGIEEAKTELETVKTSLGELDGDTAKIAAQLVLGEGADSEGFKTQVNSAIDSIGEQKINVGFNLNETAISDLNSNLLSNFTVDATAKITNVDKSQLETVETGGMVTWAENVDGVSKSFEATGTVNWDDDVKNVKTSFSANGTVNWTSGNNVKVKVISEANGTANANGTAQSGRAFARGNWGIKGSGTALGGELGQELVVRDGKFFTIGDTGAEFFHYKPNDIIFNAAQTESLFKYGGIRGAKPRGTMYANGSAFATGSYPFSGDAFFWATALKSGFAANRLAKPLSTTSNAKVETNTETKDNAVETNTKINFSGATVETTDFSKQNSESSEEKLKSKETKEFEETFDWIETAISRIEREIDNLDNKVNNTYKSWGERNSALTDEIGKVGTEITLQSDAADKYWNKAGEFLNHDSDYAKKIQEGTLDIDTLNQDNSNEELVEKIKEYQKWYELYLKCTDAAEELKQTEAELYAQRFEHIQSQYDGILQGFDHTETMLNEYISQAEAKGHIVSKQYYDALISNEHARISELKGEQKKLIDARDEYFDEQVKRYLDEHKNASKAEAETAIKYSEEWIDMSNDIDSVTQEIEEGTTAIIEYNNAIRDIDWQVFDLIQERISNITDEANFLIDLMSNKDLFDDNGKFTEHGVATVGLHALNYNTAMYQADEYAKEIAELDKQIAEDSYDQELVNRRQELIELQRESILAAEDEKNAIRDLVQDGIDAELDSLSELIDKKNEALESERNLYEYQKKVKEQTSEIANLEKKMAAYSGDDSEEAKQKIQQIKLELETAKEDLQETEYDKFIDDTSALLDSLYTEYELILNQRLDNIDFLLQQVIGGINAAAGVEGTITSALGSEGAIAAALGSNATTIKDTLKSETDKVGTTLSNEMNEIWSTGDGNAKSVIIEYGKGFQSAQTTTNTVLGNIKADITKMVDDVDKDAKENIEQPKTQPSAVANPTGGSSGNSGGGNSGASNGGNKSSGDGKPKIGDKVKFLSGKYYYDSQGVHPAGSKNQGKEVYITNVNTKSWATHPYHISTGKKLGSGDLGWLKLNQISGYATGKKNFLNNEIAWTQENGQELIVRPSDGAILTPVAKGDSVLTSAASNNIWDMANNPSEFIKDNLNLGVTNVPNNSNVNNSYSQHIDNVVFRMDNVKNYEEMLYALRDDRRFEKLVTAMTIDRIAGGSSLAKGKSIR